MTDNWNGRNDSGSSGIGDAPNSQLLGAFGRAYIGAKQEMKSFGMKVMTGDYYSQDSGSGSNYFSSFHNGDISGTENGRVGDNVAGNAGSSFTFEPIGFSDGPDAGDPSANNTNNGSENNTPDNDGLRSDIDQDVSNDDIVFEPSSTLFGDDPAAGDSDSGFDVEEENSFVFFGDDDAMLRDIDLGGFDDEGDEDVKVYHRGEYTAFETTGNKAPTPPAERRPVRTEQPVKEKNNDSFDDEFFESVYTDRGRGLRTFLIVLIIIAVLGLTVFLAYRFVKNNTLGDDTVYEGIRVNGYDLGGLTRNEVYDYIYNTYVAPVSNAKVTIKLGDSFREIYPVTDFFTLPDAAAIADQAYNYARSGADIDRIKIINELKEEPVNITCEYVYVDDGLRGVIENASTQGFASVVDPTYSIRDEGVFFTSGKAGARVNTDKFKQDLELCIQTLQKQLKNIKAGQSVNDYTIELSVNQSDFIHLSAGDIMTAAYMAPVDAELRRSGDRADDIKSPIMIVPDKEGRTLDPAALSDIVNRINAGENIPYFRLDYTPITASVTEKSLRENLFTSTLGRVTSKNAPDPFTETADGGVDDRAYNIKRAVQLFDTVELFPDQSVDVLSLFGRITSGNGFAIAYENVNNGGERVSGGGVSQFATALYECALISGLDVPRVWNSEFYPNYGTPGFDARLSTTDGNFDLIIKNPLKYPVRIRTAYVGDMIEVTIEGPDPTEGAITLSYELLEKELNARNTGTVYKYRIARVRGGVEQYLGTVVYEKRGEGVIPEETPTEEPTETPEITEEPTETPGETEIPTETPEDETPTPPPEDETPTPTPEDETPTPTPEDETPTPTPEAETPTPTPEAETPTPTPEAETPTPTPEAETPTPTPEAETPTPTPEAETPTPTPEAETPTPTPEAETPTPTPEAETPTPTPVNETEVPA